MLGGTFSGKNSTPAFSIPNATTAKTSAAAAPASIRTRCCRAHRRICSYRTMKRGRPTLMIQCPAGWPTERWNPYTRPTVTSSRTAVSQLRATMISSVTPPTPSSSSCMAVVMLTGASSVSSMRDANAGRITSATNSEELSVMISVSGRNFMNSPTMPGQNAIGRNAASVVAVDAMIGTATSPVAYFAARRRSKRRSRKR